MVKEKTIEDSMQIIIFAGNARKHCMDALKACEDNEFSLADVEMDLANKEIVQAHHVQTDAISAETSGVDSDYSVLFAHAQDTLMTIYSEINMTKRLIAVFKSYDKRILELEHKLESGKEND